MEQEENPDRSKQYTDASPVKLRDQLNENWRQLRLFKTALQDRDEVINTLHQSIRQRDEAIDGLHKRIALMNRIRPLVYAAIGGAVAKLAELLIGYLGGKSWVHF